MAEAIAFYMLAAFILGFAVLVVTSTNPVHSIVFLVLDFLSVAGLYVTLGAEFVAAIQVLVYAGGIVVLYLFVVMLVNVKRAPEAFGSPGRHSLLGMGLAGAVLLEVGAIAFWSTTRPAIPAVAGAAIPVSGNTEQVGWLLYTRYLIPFEIASMLLLIAMVGAIVLARKEAGGR
jgi:NADH-quinone oxidoreductase subunit J